MSSGTKTQRFVETGQPADVTVGRSAPVGSSAETKGAVGPAPTAFSIVETEIRPTSGWRPFDFAELYAYRDLYRFLTWRGIKVRYAQSAIGIGWAVIQPVFTMLVFSVVFGTLAGVSSDGVPYQLFSLGALVPWTYFQNSLNECSQSLVINANMISKVYFPRLIIPLAAVTGKLVDFAIALCVLGLMIAWYHFFPRSPGDSGDQTPWRFVPSVNLLALPLLALVMTLTAAGLGAWLTALAIQYRDIKHAMGFSVQLMMYASPVVYPTSSIPERYELFGRMVNPQQIYAVNPLVGVIEGFRAALLGTRAMPWDLIAIGAAAAVAIALTGALYFRSRGAAFCGRSMTAHSHNIRPVGADAARMNFEFGK